MSRIAYFKNVNPTVGLDATQNQMLNTLQGQIATKAEQAALTAVDDKVALKADSTAVDAGLALKASQNDFSVFLNQTVATLTAQNNNINNILGVALPSKLNKSVHDARIINEAGFFDSVKNSILLNDAAGNELNYVALGLTFA
jgi:hypothetical protein